MKRAVRMAGLVAALSMSAASVAKADVLVNNTFCGGNEFSTCAFVSSSSTTSGGVSVLTLTVTNPGTNPAGSVFTAIGIANLPTGASVTSGSVLSSSAGVHMIFSTSPNGLNGAGILSDAVGFQAVSPPPVNGVNPGETVTFTFTFDGVYNLNSLQYALHDQGGAPQRCGPSTKLVISGSIGQYDANDPTCGPPPVTTVPEPATMTLLASGLAGIGGIVRRRRK